MGNKFVVKSNSQEGQMALFLIFFFAVSAASAADKFVQSFELIPRLKSAPAGLAQNRRDRKLVFIDKACVNSPEFTLSVNIDPYGKVRRVNVKHFWSAVKSLPARLLPAIKKETAFDLFTVDRKPLPIRTSLRMSCSGIP